MPLTLVASRRDSSHEENALHDAVEAVAWLAGERLPADMDAPLCRAGGGREGFQVARATDGVDRRGDER